MLMKLRVRNGSDFKEEQNSSWGFAAMMSHPARIRVGGYSVAVWVHGEQHSTEMKGKERRGDDGKLLS